MSELDNLNLLSSSPIVIDKVDHVSAPKKEKFDLNKYDTHTIDTVDDRALNILSRRGINIDLKQEEFKNSFKVILSKKTKSPSLLFTWTYLNKEVAGGQYKYYEGDKCVKRFFS